MGETSRFILMAAIIQYRPFFLLGCSGMKVDSLPPVQFVDGTNWPESDKKQITAEEISVVQPSPFPMSVPEQQSTATMINAHNPLSQRPPQSPQMVGDIGVDQRTYQPASMALPKIDNPADPFGNFTDVSFDLESPAGISGPSEVFASAGMWYRFVCNCFHVTYSLDFETYLMPLSKWLTFLALLCPVFTYLLLILFCVPCVTYTMQVTSEAVLAVSLMPQWILSIFIVVQKAFFGRKRGPLLVAGCDYCSMYH